VPGQSHPKSTGERRLNRIHPLVCHQPEKHPSDRPANPARNERLSRSIKNNAESGGSDKTQHKLHENIHRETPPAWNHPAGMQNNPNLIHEIILQACRTTPT
jgi:hypothetical protein